MVGLLFGDRCIIIWNVKKQVIGKINHNDKIKSENIDETKNYVGCKSRFQDIIKFDTKECLIFQGKAHDVEMGPWHTSRNIKEKNGINEIFDHACTRKCDGYNGYQSHDNNKRRNFAMIKFIGVGKKEDQTSTKIVM